MHTYLFNILIQLKIGIFANIVNISVAPPLDPKSFDVQRFNLKLSKRL